MRQTSIGDLRAQLRQVLDDIVGTHERVVITRHGQPAAVLLSVEDLEGVEETLAILGDATLMHDIRAGLADAAAGDVMTTQELLKDLGRSA